MSESILWHDYETTGTEVARDRPMQFAAVRTDLEMRVVADPVVWFARLSDDVLPHPEACLVTGMTPSSIAADARDELEFARSVHGSMMEPGTCSAGYNSFAFDDEISRFLFWRNLLPVYDREWRDGNSRWDLIDPMRAAFALRPDGIEWAERDGVPSFRLEDLAAANGIEHDAHDALGDVYATIALARKLRAAQPKLFAHLWGLRRKRDASREFERVAGERPFVFTGRWIPNQFGCTTVLLCVAKHPRISNDMLCVDLRFDPQPLLEAGVEELKELLFRPRRERAEDAPDVRVERLRINRCPAIAPLGVLGDDEAWSRIGLTPSEVESRAAAVQSQLGPLRAKLTGVFARDAGDAEPRDPEEDLYGGFVRDFDARICEAVHRTEVGGWRGLEREFEDPRLGELLFRLRARWFPDAMDAEERVRWADLCRSRLDGGVELLGVVQELRGAGKSGRVLDEVEGLIRERLATFG